MKRGRENKGILRSVGVRVASRVPLAILLLSGIQACALSEPPPAVPDRRHVEAAHGLRLPATFRGDFPCVDCEGVRHHLDVWPDQVFHLRREWLGKDYVRYDLGRWRVDPGRRALVLYGGFEMPISLEIRGPDTLRPMDLQGRPIDPQLPYALKSDGTLAPTELVTSFGGEVAIDTAGLRFTECLTERTYLLDGGGELEKLRRACQGVTKERGQRLYVTFDGTATPRAAPGGGTVEPAITVDRFVNVWPGHRCAQARGKAELVNTYWRIVKLGGETVSPVPGRREPHLLLRLGERQHYVATMGCNQLTGSVTVNGDTIDFGRPAATRMACPPPLAELERRLGAMLARTRRWRIVGTTLELFDDDGAPTVLCEALYL